MPSVNLDVMYFEHDKTIRLVDRLGRDADVLPIRLWAYTGRHHAESGRLKGLTAREIEKKIGWRGQSGQCVKALLAVGFLERDGETYVVHDWLEHSGHLSAFSHRARKAAHARWDKARQAGAAADAPSIAQASGEQCPNPTHPDPLTEFNPPNPTATSKTDGTVIGSGGPGENGDRDRAGGPAGNLGLSLTRATRTITPADENFERMSAVQRLLNPLINDKACVTTLINRHDITPDLIKRELADIDRDPKVADRGAILRKRLLEHKASSELTRIL
jgi:hypothetical protein